MAKITCGGMNDLEPKRLSCEHFEDCTKLYPKDGDISRISKINKGIPQGGRTKTFSQTLEVKTNVDKYHEPLRVAGVASSQGLEDDQVAAHVDRVHGIRRRSRRFAAVFGYLAQVYRREVALAEFFKESNVLSGYFPQAVEPLSPLR
jgi:hypothetical protein